MGVKLDKIDAQQLEQLISTGRKYRVTVFTTRHKIVGTAFVARSDFDDTWRTSDFLRSFDHDRMTLGDVEIRDIATGTIVDKPDYVLLNLDAAEVLYAEEIVEP